MTWTPKHWHGDYGIDGCDISEYQRTFDMRRARLDGCELVFVKASEGAHGVDPLYDTHLTAARAEGIAYIGHYHFLRQGDPFAQVGNLLEQLAPHRDQNGAIPAGHAIAVDYEAHDPTGTPPPEPDTLVVFVATLEQRFGNGRIGIYTTTSLHHALTTAGYSDFLAARPLWLADRTDNAPTALTELTPALWQHAVGPFAPWYDGDLDCDHIVDRAKLNAWFGITEPTTPQEEPMTPIVIIDSALPGEASFARFSNGAVVHLGGDEDAHWRAANVPTFVERDRTAYWRLVIASGTPWRPTDMPADLQRAQP